MTTLPKKDHFKQEAPAEKSAGDASTSSPLSKIRSLALDETSIQARMHEVSAAKFIAGKLSLKGQITVFYAAPNTGKTLICLGLIAETFHQGLLDEEVYHINLDDDYLGVTTKAKLGLTNGFHTITPDSFPNPTNNFQEIIELLSSSGDANKTIFILDTAKKFADVMDKKAMSAFITECRKLTSAGGSIIILAHTNKITNDAAAVIPGGTSDLLDDCDCAYILYISDEEKTAEGVRRYVTFEQRKSRGPTVREAMYSYETRNEGDYEALFSSIRNESPESIQEAKNLSRLKKEQAEDRELIEAITDTLKQGEIAQTALIQEVQKSFEASRKQVQQCLEKWAVPANEGGLWKSRKGERNANLYQLH